MGPHKMKHLFLIKADYMETHNKYSHVISQVPH